MKVAQESIHIDVTMANQYLFTKYLSWRKRRGEVVKEEEEEKEEEKEEKGESST